MPTTDAKESFLQGSNGEVAVHVHAKIMGKAAMNNEPNGRQQVQLLKTAVLVQRG